MLGKSGVVCVCKFFVESVVRVGLVEVVPVVEEVVVVVVIWVVGCGFFSSASEASEGLTPSDEVVWLLVDGGVGGVGGSVAGVGVGVEE